MNRYVRDGLLIWLLIMGVVIAIVAVSLAGN